MPTDNKGQSPPKPTPVGDNKGQKPYVRPDPFSRPNPLYNTPPGGRSPAEDRDGPRGSGPGGLFQIGDRLL
ncbi:MAG: hypothetical protein RI947_1404 [Candidatus Parcubacteria bacterium]|jgi:hypothetical protein